MCTGHFCTRVTTTGGPRSAVYSAFATLWGLKHEDNKANSLDCLSCCYVVPNLCFPLVLTPVPYPPRWGKWQVLEIDSMGRGLEKKEMRTLLSPFLCFTVKFESYQEPRTVRCPPGVHNLVISHRRHHYHHHHLHNKSSPPFYWCFLHVLQYTNCHPCVSFLNPHRISLRQMRLSLFYRWGDWGIEMCYWVLALFLCHGDSVVSKTEKAPVLMELVFHWRKADKNQGNKQDNFR